MLHDAATACQKYAACKKTLAFCGTVEQAKQFVKSLTAVGISAEFISGKTPHVQRAEIISRWNRREFGVLCGAQVLDQMPALAEVVVSLRPTSCKAVFLYQIWSARLPPALFLDFAGNLLRHGLPAGFSGRALAPGWT